MYWVMVVVIAIVVFGVAAVAAGQGGGMAPAHPDRPDAPAAAGVPPAEGEPRFGVALRGYRMDEVDEAIDRLIGELDARDRRIAELEWRLDAAENRPRERGEG